MGFHFFWAFFSLFFSIFNISNSPSVPLFKKRDVEDNAKEKNCSRIHTDKHGLAGEKKNLLIGFYVKFCSWKLKCFHLGLDLTAKR